MAQLIVRNLPDEVKLKLKKRAEKHGRSVEAEARAILSEATDISAISAAETGLGTQLAKKLARHKVSKTDWDAFDENMRQLRRSWRMRDIDFGS